MSEAIMSELFEIYTAHANDSDQDVADAALRSLRVPNDARVLLLPVVTDHVRLWRRWQAAMIERGLPTVPLTDSGALPSATALTSPLLRDELLRSEFRIGTGESFLWGTATIAQHEARVAFLEKMAAGIKVTIDLHRDAIDLIHSHGVTCLAEIGAVAA